jgi:DNA-binding response OmpR family regulator
MSPQPHRVVQAVKVARETRPDAIVLDMMLPDFDGLEVMRRIRAEDPDVPVIFLTAKDSVEDRIGGLTAGGDDYVTKPFSLEEVIARLRALLRRSGAALARSDSTLVVGDLTLDEDSHEVRRGGVEIQLTGHRVRATPLPDAQTAASAQQGPDPGSGLELRLRRPRQTSSSSTFPTSARRSTPTVRR